MVGSGPVAAARVFGPVDTFEIIPEIVGGRCSGDSLAGAARTQLGGIVEQVADDFQRPGLAEGFERNLMDLLGGGREIGVNDDPVEVAGDKRGRVLQRLAVLEELCVGGVKVLVAAFVFDGEVAAFPDVGVAVAAALLGRALLETEDGADGIGLRRGRVADQGAEVEEVAHPGYFLEILRSFG